MIFLISTGEYSDYSIFAIVEGEGDIKALYRQFREQYTPEMLLAIQSGKTWLEHSFYDLIKFAEKRFLDNGMTQSISQTLEDGFVNWLVSEHGFRIVESDEVNVDWRELPND